MSRAMYDGSWLFPQFGFALGALIYSCTRIAGVCAEVLRILGFPGRCPRRPCLILNENALRSGLGFLTQNPQNTNLVFHQVGQICLYRAPIKAFERSPRDLALGHGFRACSLKNKRRKLDVHNCSVKKLQKNWTVRRNRWIVGPWSCKRYQKDPQGWREDFRK